ncbi:THO2 plays a role in transcriptional elongation, partial [Coemansia spiralis]
MLGPARGEDISKEFDAWCAAQKETRAPGATNRLADMGSLEDAGDNSERGAAAEAQAAEAGSVTANQHAALCAKLLAIGDTADALVYLKRFPNLARVHPEIADQVVRIIDMATAGIYQRTDCVRTPQRPYLRLRARAAALGPDTPAAGPWGMPSRRQQGQPPEVTATTKQHVLSPQAVGPGDEFFYEDFWLLQASRHLPAVTTIDDMPSVLAPWLNVGFLRLHRTPALLTRLIRLCRYGMQQPSKQDVWTGFLRAWILPAYSLSKPSAGLSNELWRLVSVLELPARFALYSDWSAMLTSSQPMLPRLASCGLDGQNSTRADTLDMAMSLDDMLEGDDDDDGSDGGAGGQTAYVEIEALNHSTRRQVRSMMRRLSGDTVKLIGRQLCNLCHPTPTLSLKIILDQVCSYDNLVDSVVEAFRYLTPL